MKLNGIFGTGSGKVGASVWAVNSGVQIVRPYQPKVTNPNTDAQVEQRAKLKLMSQLAAALARGLAFKKQGLVSARNQFVSKNIGLATFADNKAEVDLTALQITPGTKTLPDVETEQGQSSGYVMKLTTPAATNIKRVVYVVCRNNADGQTEIVEIKIATEAGANRDFQASTTSSNTDMFVLAYGVEDLNAAATAKYESYYGDPGTTDAELVVEFLRSSVDYTFTQTKGTTIA